MAEQASTTDNKELERARELLNNPRIAWHSVNGFDFGAVIGILEQGIHPYTQFGGREAVSLASSPSDPTLTDHPTFDYYVPKSISFPVPLHGLKVSPEDGHDEYQYEGIIPRSEIYGLMIPEAFATTHLTELPLLKPPTRSKTGSYISRHLDSINLLSSGSIDLTISKELERLKAEYLEIYDEYDARKQVSETLNRFILAQYESAFAKLIGMASPDLHQAVEYLADRYGVDRLIMPMPANS